MAGLSFRVPQICGLQAPRAMCSTAARAALREKKLVLYSKPGCCLCDGLKEKIHAAFLIGGDDSLAGTSLEVDHFPVSLSRNFVSQVRDITSNPAWENAYQFEIPVLARINDDGVEEVLPRMSMRISVEQLHKKVAAALKS